MTTRGGRRTTHKMAADGDDHPLPPSTASVSPASIDVRRQFRKLASASRVMLRLLLASEGSAAVTRSPEKVARRALQKIESAISVDEHQLGIHDEIVSAARDGESDHPRLMAAACGSATSKTTKRSSSSLVRAHGATEAVFHVRLVSDDRDEPCHAGEDAVLETRGERTIEIVVRGPQALERPLAQCVVAPFLKERARRTSRAMPCPSLSSAPASTIASRVIQHEAPTAAGSSQKHGHFRGAPLTLSRICLCEICGMFVDIHVTPAAQFAAAGHGGVINMKLHAEDVRRPVPTSAPSSTAAEAARRGRRRAVSMRSISFPVEVEHVEKLSL